MSTIFARHFAFSLLAAFLFALLVPQSGFAQADPLIGTWKLNVARSTYTAGPAPRSTTVNFQGAGANLTATAETTDAQGRPIRSVFLRIYDGQPHPTTGSPDFDASAYTRIDANTFIYSRMKAGKLVEVGTQVLAQDGRTLTITTRAVNAGGQQLNNVGVFEKQ